MSFLCENWFLRGVQSAAFYYLSCAPCIDKRYKKKRRQQAAAAQDDIVVTTQPGIIQQPRAFETNEAWTEEILAGPGPPPRWKNEKLFKKLKQRRATIQTTEPSPGPPPDESATLTVIDPRGQPVILPEEAVSDVAEPISAQDTSSSKHRKRPSDTRPRNDRKSSTIDNLKDTFKQSIHPDRWNWKRYEREDEVLGGFKDKGKELKESAHRIWDRATANITLSSSSKPLPEYRPPSEDGSEVQYEWQRPKNPEINELHPPVVSQLPSTREKAAWMLLPPPRAGVMEGKVPPDADAGKMRWPLAIIGTTQYQVEWERERRARAYSGKSAKSTKSSKQSHQLPSLSFTPTNASEDSDLGTPTRAAAWFPPSNPLNKTTDHSLTTNYALGRGSL